MRFDAMRCDAMRCGALRCDAMRLDRCGVIVLASEVAILIGAPVNELKFLHSDRYIGSRTCSTVWVRG